MWAVLQLGVSKWYRLGKKKKKVLLYWVIPGTNFCYMIVVANIIL